MKRPFLIILALMLGVGTGFPSCASDPTAQRHAQMERSRTAAPQQPAMKTPESARTDMKTETLSDANIFALLLVANSSDLQGAQLATQKAEHPQVKAFGGLMVEEHSDLLQQGDKLARELNIVPVITQDSEKLVQEHNRTMEELSAKSGSTFDQAYIDHEIKMHQRVLQRVDQASQSAQHPRLKQLLNRTKPALAAHLEAAQGIEKNLKGETGTSSSPEGSGMKGDAGKSQQPTGSGSTEGGGSRDERIHSDQKQGGQS